MEWVLGILGLIFFFSQFFGLREDNKKHEQRQRDEGTDGIWYVKADNAYSSCFAWLGLIVLILGILANLPAMMR